MFYTIVGTQWGDEGKGKIVDWLSSKADLVVRFQGGNNAGHTIKVNDVTYKLNLLPSGIIRNKKCFIGNNKHSFYTDLNHLSIEGAKLTMHKFSKYIEKF